MEEALAAVEEAKSKGNNAISAGDFQAAESYYTEALEKLPEGADNSVYVTLLCNRAHARHQSGQHRMAIEDATTVLERLPVGAGHDKLRLKALYRRALASEAIGDFDPAYVDLNLALKISPSNIGLQDAAKRVKELCSGLKDEPPLEIGPAWMPELPYYAATVIQKAFSDAIPCKLKGYCGANDHPVIRYANGLGVQIHGDSGALRALGNFGPPEIPDDVVFPQNTDPPADFWLSPQFDLADGYWCKYDREGHLTHIWKIKARKVDGLAIGLDREGRMLKTQTGVWKDGILDCAYASPDIDKPASFIAHALVEMIIPTKKALGINCSPGEDVLCEMLHINPDHVSTENLSRRGQAFEEHRQWLMDRLENPLKEPAPKPVIHNLHTYEDSMKQKIGPATVQVKMPA